MRTRSSSVFTLAAACEHPSASDDSYGDLASLCTQVSVLDGEDEEDDEDEQLYIDALDS
jgi:hypothetical protein